MIPKFPDRPFVGKLGSANTLAVTRTPDRLVCGVTRSSVWFSQIMLFLFGSFLAFVLWAAFQDRSFRMPLPFSIIAWVLAAACWLVFIRNLAGAPRVECVWATGDMLFFRSNFGGPSRTLKRLAGVSFTVDTQSYTYRSRQTANFILSVLTTDKARIVLCASPDETLIRSIESELTRGLGGG